MNTAKTLLASLLIGGALGILAGCSGDVASEAATTPDNIESEQEKSPIRQDAEMNAFIDDLMEKMTLEEKVGQLNLLTSNWDRTGPTMKEDYKKDIRAGRVGAIFNAFTADYTRGLQKIAVEETRLGIPLLFGYDVIHGHRTIFPVSIGESASWDLGAIEQAARIAAIEASAEGIHWTFAPMVDIARDPRWGRISEGAGEDVFLATEIAKARIRGFQGDDLSDTDTVLACAKHYAAYGAAQAGRDYHTTDMSERELFSTYLPPFEAAVEEGVATFMTAFNDLNGVPASASNYLLNDLLKDQWGFDGFVVTDYTSINELVPHGYARDENHAAELAINAGVDMDMQGATFYEHMSGLVEEGRVAEDRVDDAVRRILEMKYRLGLFEDPYRYSNKARQQEFVYKDEHLRAATEMAKKSMVLLKNQNDTLPLRKNDLSIALIGPLANSKEDMIGSWSAAGDRYERPVTLLEGIREKVGDSVEINYAKGASYEFDSKGSASGFKEAIEKAQQSDVIVLAMGEKWNMTGEAASRTSLDMPGNQLALMKELKKLNKPMILVLMSGRPMTLTWEDRNLDAILEAWYPGTMAGVAVADVLFGDYNPSGKLTSTFPRTVGQVPIYYNMKNTGRPYEPEGAEQKYRSRYLNTPNEPLYPFGYGLSYTTFEYTNLTLGADTVTMGDTLTVSVDVTNTGDRSGEEVVQLYVRDVTGSVTRPVKELKGFRKISLEQGERKTVEFTLSEEDLSFYRADMSYGAEPGQFTVFVGSSSRDVLEAGFKLVSNK